MGRLPSNLKPIISNIHSLPAHKTSATELLKLQPQTASRLPSKWPTKKTAESSGQFQPNSSSGPRAAYDQIQDL